MAEPRGDQGGLTSGAEGPILAVGDRPGATQTAPAIEDTGEVGPPRKTTSRKNRFTCGGCPAVWSFERYAHCSACHRTFTSVSGFDKHRSPDGEHGTCMTPSRIGLVERGDGLWSYPAPDPTRTDLSWRTR